MANPPRKSERLRKKLEESKEKIIEIKQSTMSNIRAPRYGTEKEEPIASSSLKSFVYSTEEKKKEGLVLSSKSTAEETGKEIVPSHFRDIELSMEEVHSLRSIYESWPTAGITGVFGNVLPKEYRVAAMNSEFIGEPFLTILREWESKDLASNPPFGKLATEFDASLTGMVGYPVPSNFSVLSLPATVDLEAVQLAVQENIVVSILVFLFLHVPARTRSLVITDLYRTLRDPESINGLTFLGQWYYGCIREHLILPKFGTVEAFVELIIRLQTNSRGYGLLLLTSIVKFDIDLVKNILPEEHGLHHIMEMLYVFDGCALAPFSYFYPLVEDFLEGSPPLMWSPDDCNKAHDILKTFDVNDTIDTFY